MHAPLATVRKLLGALGKQRPRRVQERWLLRGITIVAAAMLGFGALRVAEAIRNGWCWACG